MKNINENQLEKSISMKAEDFIELVHTLTAKWFTIEANGIFLSSSDFFFFEKIEVNDDKHVLYNLSKHFNVKVTSINADNSGVHITCKDRKISNTEPYLVKSFINFSSVQIRKDDIYGACKCKVFQTYEDYLNDDYEVHYDAFFVLKKCDFAIINCDLQFVSEITSIDKAFVNDLLENIYYNILLDKEKHENCGLSDL